MRPWRSKGITTGTALIALLAIGCTAGTARYAPPSTNVKPPPLSQRVERSVDATWDALVEATRNSGYKLTEWDRPRGSMGFSFGILQPWDYVTGGSYRQTDKSAYRKAVTRYSPVVTFTGDWVQFATEHRGGSLDAMLLVQLEPAGAGATMVSYRARYRFSEADLQWQFETGGCDRQAVPNAAPDTPFDRVLCPTHRAESGMREILGRL